MGFLYYLLVNEGKGLGVAIVLGDAVVEGG